MNKKKQTIRLDENQFHGLINKLVVESVRRYLNERTAGEKDMTDDEVKASRTARGGYKPGSEKYETEVDYGGGPSTKTFTRKLSPEQMRQKAHKASRGKKKPIAKSSDWQSHKHINQGYQTNDYDEYVLDSLVRKYNGIKLDYNRFAVPVENMWSQEAYDIGDDVERYGYGRDESYPNEYIKYDAGDKYDPNTDYVVFLKGKSKTWQEIDDRGGLPFYDNVTNPYGIYDKTDLPERPKIGRTGF